MSSAHELAVRLVEEVRRLRLERIGECADSAHYGFTDLSKDEQQPWLDCAEAMLVILGERAADIMRLRGLCDDWERYGYVLGQDPAWRDEMRRAVVIEMRTIIDRLWKEAGGG